MLRIGVFDSGIGGEAVAHTLATAFPIAEITSVNDKRNVPYGDRTPEEIIMLTNKALQPLFEGNFDYVVIACNTATAAAIEWLRSTYPTQVFIGLEPMVKPASELTISNTIAVLATHATLSSERYLNLKKEYLIDKKCIEPDCSSWAKMIEDTDINELNIQQTVDFALSEGADVIVLACTHYHWIRELIENQVNGRAAIIDPSEAIVNRIIELTTGVQHQRTDRRDHYNS